MGMFFFSMLITAVCHGKFSRKLGITPTRIGGTTMKKSKNYPAKMEHHVKPTE
jgi:hypothetical protein